MATAARVRDQDRTLALVAVAFTVALWGCSNVIIKILSVTGQVASFYRLWFAVPLVWAIALSAPGVRRQLDRSWMVATLVGGLLFSAHQMLFFNAIKFTSVANVTIISALQPALVLLVAGRMFGERPRLAALLWSGVAFAGTVAVVIGAMGTPSWSPFGDLLAVANLFAFTAYFLWSKRVRSRLGATEYTVGITTVAAGAVLVVTLATDQDLASPSGMDLLLLVFIAIVPGTIGHFLANWAHAHASAFAMSIVLLALPVVASTGAVVFLDEPLTPLQIGGGACALLAIGVIVRVPEHESDELARSAAETDAP